MRTRTVLLPCATLLLCACNTSTLPTTSDAGGSGCTYNGKHYAVGDTFKSSDGCNDCSCEANGRAACTLRACADSGAPSSLSWFKTCGAPVCGPNTNGPTGQPLCTNEKVGDHCIGQGAMCDPGVGCGVNLVCAASDPTKNPGGCPIRARATRKTSAT
jgi:hypothetical protein